MDWKEADRVVESFHEPELAGGCPIQIAAAILKPDKWGIKRVVSGRGVTRREAASRCLSEALERHAAIYEEDLDFIRGTPADLGTAAIDPQSLLLISDRQYAQALQWNSGVSTIHQLPSRLDQSQDIAWIKARSLIDESMKLVPAACCFLGYPRALEVGFPIPDSNGLASGDCLADAIERALLEVIERDAVSIWWYGRVSRPAMEMECDKFPLWRPFEEWTRRSERRFWLLDLTHDLGVPVAAAISSDRSGGKLSFGFAAARTRQAAAQAAMGELVQFEVTIALQSRSHSVPSTGFLAWCISARLDDYRFLLPSKTAYPHQIVPSADGAVSMELITEKKLDVLVVDLTPQNQNTKAVRVLAPNLRLIWPRFAPGRLYDVPYELGWHDSRLNETELNPIHILY
jgi:YcaO-like protein with predicted kinase domain